MRIFQFVEASNAGVGRHVVELTAGLLDRGHEVHLVYSPLRADAAFRVGLDRLGRLLNYSVTALEVRRSPSVDDLKHGIRLLRLLRVGPPYDIVHCHSTKAGILGRIAGLSVSSRVVYTPHAFYTLNPLLNTAGAAIAAAVERTLARATDAVIAVSQREYTHAVQHLGLDPRRVFLNHNGIDRPSIPDQCLRTRIRRELGLMEAHICIGFVGRLARQKALDFLLAAFAELRPPVRERAYLCIVGTGELISDLKLMADRLRVADHIIWAGERNAHEFMCAFDVFALASDYEAFPYVLLEAVGHGLPIVATDVGGTDELVEMGENGFVVDRRDLHGFTDSLAKVLSDSALRHRMSRKSLIIAAKFSHTGMIERTLDVYGSVLSEA